MAMTFPTTLDPWRERGIPLEQQCRSWKQRIKTPYHKLDVDPYTRVRVILMNGIENEAWAYSHHLARCTGKSRNQITAGPHPHGRAATADHGELA